MISLKRLATITASVSGGIIVAAAAVGLGVHWYYYHPRPAREWPDIRLSQRGIRGSLRTQWRDDKLSYQFRISPLHSEELEGFSQAVKSNSQPYAFTLELTDSAGFSLCKVPVSESEIKALTDDAGRLESLIANTSASYECSLDNYIQASEWTFSWKYFPSVTDVSSGLVPKKGATKVPLSDLGFKPDASQRAKRNYQIPPPPAGFVPEPKADEPPAGYYDVAAPWKDKSHWRKLQKGMSKDEVRKLLGEPGKVTAASGFDLWYYPDVLGGRVEFDKQGIVTGWGEP